MLNSQSNGGMLCLHKNTHHFQSQISQIQPMKSVFTMANGFTSFVGRLFKHVRSFTCFRRVNMFSGELYMVFQTKNTILIFLPYGRRGPFPVSRTCGHRFLISLSPGCCLISHGFVLKNVLHFRLVQLFHIRFNSNNQSISKPKQ